MKIKIAQNLLDHRGKSIKTADIDFESYLNRLEQEAEQSENKSLTSQQLKDIRVKHFSEGEDITVKQFFLFALEGVDQVESPLAIFILAKKIAQEDEEISLRESDIKLLTTSIINGTKQKPHPHNPNVMLPAPLSPLAAGSALSLLVE